jgi:hypothetical protein
VRWTISGTIFIAEILVAGYGAGLALWSHSRLTNAVDSTIDERSHGGRVNAKVLKEALLKKATEVGVKLDEHDISVDETPQSLDIHISWQSPVLTIAARDWLVIPMTLDRAMERPAGR